LSSRTAPLSTAGDDHAKETGILSLEALGHAQLLALGIKAITCYQFVRGGCLRALNLETDISEARE
jgi:hypothetical protein